ncbi:hypothetical protein TRFO_20068 [Tritrichomonas foetus]|uniref:DNA-directed primase/polymerase protein n=1 Tax=Tritrichomonas foetus TaxID=1144522 RepID=A0A1J4KGP0_9EUKA|nr:hypothetical protein TRFO_20068 [Tritrichomonas foetus]|eukprot:OHT10575.1 hypothetical protein TRFO_20068 [Tritrichomonas foetus]
MSDDKIEEISKNLAAVHYQFAPCEVQHLINDITKKVIVPIKKIDMSEINQWQGLFSWEYSTTGTRTFFLSKYENVYKLFNYLNEYHLYEVIPENFPCHLYFDCEFKFKEHPELDGDEIIKNLIMLVDEKLLSLFGRSDYEVIDLEATTPEKFSRHLIFHSDRFMFRNNKHVGHFVKTEILTVPEFQIVVDEAVYTKNRNFRCIWSTKVANGTKFPLVPKDKTNWHPSFSSYEYFLKSLISYSPRKKPHLIGYPEIKTTTTKTKEIPIEIKNQSQSSNCNPYLTNQNININGINNINNVNINLPNGGIEDFALKSLAPLGYVAKEVYTPEFDTLTLFVEGTKYCHKIGREHKSNHIYIVCKLAQGTIAQKCFDPDCRGFESDPVDIPADMLEILRGKYIPTHHNPNYVPYEPKKEKRLTLIERIVNENSSPIENES